MPMRPLPSLPPRTPALLPLLLLPWLAGGATASSLETRLLPFTGDDSAVAIVLEPEDGGIRFTVNVDEGLGDLQAVFFDIADDALLSALSVSGEDVTGFEIGEVVDLGQGANLLGGGSPCPCDVGVRLGSSGIGSDDLQSSSFVLSHASQDLVLSLFFEQAIGVRVTSVGAFGDRSGSSKLGGSLPVPEPSTALLLAGGLALLAGRRGRDRG